MTMERMPCLPFGRTESGSFSTPSRLSLPDLQHRDRTKNAFVRFDD